MASDDRAIASPLQGREDDEGFGARWSRRKLEARRNEQDDPVRGPDLAAGGGEVLPATESDAPALTDADMPPIESLGEDSDYSPFLSPQVSTELRRKALRKLFGLPRFRGSDGLNDYDEDFRRFTALGDMITHEMRRRLELEVKRADRAADRKEAETPPVTAVTTSAGEGTAPDAPAAEAPTTPAPDSRFPG